MDVPYKELKQVILNLTENDDPVLHKATVDKHFLPTASFLHPIVNIKSAPDSRETIKQVYAVYKVLTKDVKIYFQNITIDLENTRAVVELEESVSASFVPFGLLHVERVKIITVLDLVKDKRDGKYYISRQYGAVFAPSFML
ncbi:hypothetical protein OEA41_005736 [Lepraria neglecta]|uniref:SigF-like NTF2-like domain-containing protein n=1 Tax=Lepraria neglecta TaxID=209136 RepID=A0AAD9Z6E7_9LECA|nr:hypothetical protein OEA41_005736 [Lepraria neglecta]